MSWLDKILPSRIRAEKEGKGSVPEGLWHKCTNCDAVIYRAEFEKNLNVCPKCNHHGRISARKRADIILDKDGRIELFSDIMPIDMLNFKDKEKFKQATYITVVGNDNTMIKNDMDKIDMLNRENNKYGEEIKVVLASKAGGEGIDLHRIREVHILDPWYHLNRIEQTIVA